MKPILTDTLKKTVTDGRKFKTLSLVVESQGVCAREFTRLGISPETLSFLGEAMDRISKELYAASEYVKIQEEFGNITKDFKSEDGHEKKA